MEGRRREQSGRGAGGGGGRNGIEEDGEGGQRGSLMCILFDSVTFEWGGGATLIVLHLNGEGEQH